MHIMHSRRDFLAGLSAAGAAGVLGGRSSHADEPPPETTTVRLMKFFPASCDIPEYFASELLRAEGLTDVRFVRKKRRHVVVDRAWRAGFRLGLSVDTHRLDRSRRADHGSGRHAF